MSASGAWLLSAGIVLRVGGRGQVGSRFGLSRAVPLQGNLVGVMDDAIEDGVGDGRLPATGESMEIDAFVFERAPESLDEDVVEEPTAPVHRDPRAGVSQALGPGPGGELAALIGVKDLRRAMAFQGLVQGVEAELDIHGVGQTPRQHLAVCSPFSASSATRALNSGL